jgi:DNA-binding transcriptional LysR family regulator
MGTMRELDLLGTFLEVHRARSITSAAHQLRLSQPSVSERLARLEEHLGQSLFVRTSRGVSPTPDGDRLAARIREPVDRLRAVWESLAPDIAGTVRVGGPADVVTSRVVPALAPLSMRGVRIDYTLGRSRDLFVCLAEGNLDIVVSTYRPTSTALRSHGLIDEEFVLIGAPSLARSIDSALLRHDPAAALAHLPLVAYDDDLLIIDRYWTGQFGHAPDSPVHVIVPDLRGVVAAVVAGAGISAVPRYLAEPAVTRGSVEILYRPQEATINTIFLVIRADDATSAATSAVIALLVDTARTWEVF